MARAKTWLPASLLVAMAAVLYFTPVSTQSIVVRTASASRAVTSASNGAR